MNSNELPPLSAPKFLPRAGSACQPIVCGEARVIGQSGARRTRSPALSEQEAGDGTRPTRLLNEAAADARMRKGQPEETTEIFSLEPPPPPPELFELRPRVKAEQLGGLTFGRLVEPPPRINTAAAAAAAAARVAPWTS